MPALVTLGKVTTSATFYIVQAGSTLLGLDLIKALNYQFAGRTVGTIPPAPVYETDKESSSAIGCVKGFIHKVQVNPNVPPVQQKLRRLLLCVREEVSRELQCLLQAEVIEKIDASPWVSPIVVTQKNKEVLDSVWIYVNPTKVL